MVQNRAKVYYGGQLCKCEYMSDNEVNEGTVRVSLRIPARMVDRIDESRYLTTSTDKAPPPI